jgi:hypothetical protein
MEIHATKNPSGITVRPSSDGMSSNKEFIFRRNGKTLAHITLYIDGAIFIQQASYVHIREALIKDLERDSTGYCDIELIRPSGQEK